MVQPQTNLSRSLICDLSRILSIKFVFFLKSCYIKISFILISELIGVPKIPCRLPVPFLSLPLLALSGSFAVLYLYCSYLTLTPLLIADVPCGNPVTMDFWHLACQVVLVVKSPPANAGD